MSLPFFYIENTEPDNGMLLLDEDNSRHVVSVLRMQEGESLHLTDGKGSLLTAGIAQAHKKKCRVSITGTAYTLPPSKKISIGISLVKNPVRFEWFLEKATEIGITDIVPLLCSRTEKQHFRQDRMKNVLISAMLQSRQTWLPVLQQPIKFEQAILQAGFQQKFIAHCIEENKQPLNVNTIQSSVNQFILIGPEGDFTTDEVAMALKQDFIPVTLGTTRLRSETAGMVAAVLLKNLG
jgi:16S rRNA (uracil1498-N3)-methyltransferase